MPLRLTRSLRHRRNRLTALLFGLAILTAVLLLSGVRESDFFRVSLSQTTPDSPTAAPGGNVAGQVSGTQVQATLTGATYSGLDDQGRQWRVTARQAEQVGMVAGAAVSHTLATGSVSSTALTPESAVVLHQVTASYTDPSNTTPFMLASDQGTFYQEHSQLHLQGHVVLTGAKIVVEAPALTAQLTSRTAVGDQGAVITSTQSNRGMRLTGQTLRVDEPAGRVTLTGNVRAVFSQP